MAGRPKKKPEYNPELQFNNFLQELRDAYEEADSLRSLADIRGVSYIYPILWRFGLIRVPEAIEKNMGKQR